MNIFDWCVLGFGVASIILGVLRGGTKEVLGLGGWIGGLVLAFLGAPLLSPLLIDWVAANNIRWLAAFVLIYLAVRIAAWGLGKLLAEMIVATRLGAVDKLIGALFGSARAVVIILIVGFLCMMTQIPTTALWQGAFSSPFIHSAVIALTPFLPADAQRWIKR